MTTNMIRTAIVRPKSYYTMPHLPLTGRSFHSSPIRAAVGGGGKQRDSSFHRSQSLDAHFVQFRVNRSQAEAAYQAWAKKQYFAPTSLTHLSNVHAVDEAYLPFYVFDLGVRTRITGGRIGFHETESYYNTLSKRWETRTVTQWRTVPHGQETTHVEWHWDRLTFCR